MGRFNVSQVVCPRYGTLCSGANFDCYSSCSRWANRRDENNRNIKRERYNFVDSEQKEFSQQMRNWLIGENCPRCGAAVPADKMQQHKDWHWTNDANLSL